MQIVLTFAQKCHQYLINFFVMTKKHCSKLLFFLKFQTIKNKKKHVCKKIAYFHIQGEEEGGRLVSGGGVSKRENQNNELKDAKMQCKAEVKLHIIF